MARIASSTTDTPTENVEKEGKPTVITQITKTEADANAEAIVKRRELPKAPGRYKVNFEALTEWSANLTPDQLERLYIYVYRLYPEINRQQVTKGIPNYIDCLNFIPTYEYMKDMHGGGKFGITLKDTDTDKIFFESFLDIPITDNPPKYDLRETDWNSVKNRSFIGKLRSEGKVDESNNVIQPNTTLASNNTGSQSNLDPLALVDKVTQIYDKANSTRNAEMLARPKDDGGISKSIADIMIENMKQNDPTKFLTLVKEFMPKAVVPIPDTTMATILPIMMKMMEMQSTQAQANVNMMMEVMKNNSSSKGGGDPLANAERLLDFIDRRSKPNSEGETTTDKIIGAVERIGVPLFEVITNAVMMKQSGMPMHRPTPSQPAPQNQAPPVGIDPHTAQGREAMRRLAQQSNSQQPTANQELIELFRRFTPMIINAHTNNLTGADFGQSVEDLAGIQVISQVIAVGEQALFDAAKSVPELWTVIAPTPEREIYMQEWLTDFVNYKSIVAMGQEETANVQ